MEDIESKIVVFQEKQIRRAWVNEAWWYVLVDVIEVLTDSADPRQYLEKLRKRDPELDVFVRTNCTGVDFKGSTGKTRKYLSADTEGVFRVIMSVPSPKAEPFKRWFAKVAHERVQEIENPELAIERARELYRSKGYPDKWIETRIKSIEIRQELTDEWKGRGVQEGTEYAILTAEISKATFGITPSEYKSLKSLKRENLRDHMTNLELIFTMLGEEGTKTEAIKRDSNGFEENQVAAVVGGTGAGMALKAYEEQTGQQVISETNFMQQIEEAQKQRKKGLKKGKKQE